ncbi:MAG: SDR family NAD(P)-dependent oxidoreductase, partial [Bdellovibrionota bacterium]
MKKALVTGAAGFIGSHLCEYLVKKGIEVRAFVHYNSQNAWGWLENSSSRGSLEIASGDLRDFDSVSRAIKGVDSVFHLGALIGIPYSYESPLAYVRTNVEGTYNILESSRREGVNRVLVTSTSEVYGTARYVPIDEKHPLQPQSPYSASKIGADNLALSYFMSFKTPVVVARPFNTYGPRQSARAIIPTIATQMLAKKKQVELGNLAPVRDLTFVEDTVSAMHAIVSNDRFLGQTVNIGSGQTASIGELFEKLALITGIRPEIKQDPRRVRPDASEVLQLVSNTALLRSNSDWQP